MQTQLGREKVRIDSGLPSAETLVFNLLPYCLGTNEKVTVGIYSIAVKYIFTGQTNLGSSHPVTANWGACLGAVSPTLPSPTPANGKWGGRAGEIA